MIVQTHTRAELLARLDDHVRRMKSAGVQFDQGELVTAREMAVHVRALIHHTVTSHALINELGLQSKLTWVDTAGVAHPRNLAPVACLTLMKIGTGPHSHGTYVPKKDLYPPVPIRTRDGGRIDRGSRIPFDHWWTNAVMRDPNGVDYSRKQLVLALANDEGGAHDDPDMMAAFDAVAESNWLGWVVSDRTDSVAGAFESNPLMASMRQIAYEVDQSIRQQRDIIDAM
jgi:hypothetical protein